MVFYLALIVILFLFYKGFKRKSSLIILLILILLILFRDISVGTDTEGYAGLISSGYYHAQLGQFVTFLNDFFQGNTSLFATENVVREFSFTNLVLLLETTRLPTLWIINIIAVLVLFIYYRAFKTFLNNDEVPIALLLLVSSFIYFSSFNTLRQALAVALFFYSFSFLEKKKIPLFILILLLAITIHSSVILVLPVLLVYRLKIPEKWIVGVLITVVLIDAFQFRLVFFDRLYELMDSESMIYSQLVGRSTVAKEEAWYVHLLNVAFHVILAISFWGIYKLSKGTNYKYMNILFIGIVFYLLTCRTPIVSRVSEYFLCFQMVFIPRTLSYSLKNFGKKKVDFFSYMPFVFAFSWYFYHLVANWEGMIPYKFHFPF